MVMTHLSLGDASLITVTFLFTDIEGSTGLWERQPDAMRSALQRHNVLLAQAISRHHGYVFKTVGDAFCVTFDDPGHAVAAAFDIQRGLANERWPLSTPLRVRVALHTGAAYLCEGDYFGTTVNRCARLLAVTRGGQTLLTSATQTLLRDPLPSGCQLRDTGMLRLRDLPHPIHVFQLIHPGLSAELQQITEDVTKPTSQPLARLRPIDVYEVPTLPAVVMHALHVLQDPDSDAKAVQQVISNDPAISAKILRVANSAFFGRSRRVGTIALVHDTLSHGLDETVAFDEVADLAVRAVVEVARSDRPVTARRVGSFGRVRAEHATSLAMVVSELVQNAAEHGVAARGGTITVEVKRKEGKEDTDVLTVSVTDDGVGLPGGRLPSGAGLGTQIVQSLVQDLRGRISWSAAEPEGTRVKFTARLRRLPA